MMLQLIFVLSALISITVSSDVVRLVGDSVKLDIQRPVPEFEDLTWAFNKTNNVVVYYKKHKDISLYFRYEDRVEFNDKTYSLTLKNLQKTDSGLYEARTSGDKVKVIAEYRLSVLDPVETPVLTYRLNRDTCSITLTCRGHDLSISSSCYKGTCKEQEMTSPGGVTLSLFVSGSSIICYHSNPVSWKEAVLKVGELCADEDEDEVSSDVVRLVGESVQLDIQRSVPEFDDLIWAFNKTNNVLKYNEKHKDIALYSRYEDRVEFNDKTYRLTLKNLQKTDSGLYEARAVGDKVKLVAEYRLSVWDPVEAPVLTHQLNTHRDTCNITLTCSGPDRSISLNCYIGTCEQKMTSPDGVALSLSVSGSSIICNHSNPVSWKKDVMKMGVLKQLCADRVKDKDAVSPAPSAGVSVYLLKTVYTISLILMLSF